MENLKTKIGAIVSGEANGMKFSQELWFTLIPPKDGTQYYGTGCSMTVKTPERKHYVDVRYEKTKDVETLADRWIEGYYGDNAREVVKMPPEE